MSEHETRALKIVSVREQGRDIRSFDLMTAGAENAHGVTFIPGQVAARRVADEEPAYFAFAGAPGDRELGILVKRSIGTSVALLDMGVCDETELLGAVGHGWGRA